jgi:hypothetical protein
VLKKAQHKVVIPNQSEDARSARIDWLLGAALI